MTDWYKMLWSRIGGRPWTYIARDIYHRAEYVVLVSIFTSGFWAGASGVISWNWFWILLATYSLGFLHGHFFWGKKYIPGQTPDRRRR